MKIFRKIRFEQLTKSNFGKYFVYAIGEIVLVVIGILLALYFNSKKDESDQLKTQRNHLSLIRDELENNLVILKDEDLELGNLVGNIKNLINLKNDNSALDQINETDLSSLLFLPLTRAIEIDYENGAFDSFVTSNRLKDVKNDSLKTMLRSWERKLETLKTQEKVVKESLSKAVDFVEESGSIKTVLDNVEYSEYLGINKSSNYFSNKDLIQSRQFENILVQYLGVATQLYEKNYSTFENDIVRLIRLIDRELNR